MKKYLFFSTILCTLILIGCTSEQPTPPIEKVKTEVKPKMPSYQSASDLKDSTTASIMIAMFGNYDEAAKKSVAKLETIQIDKMKERVFGDHIDSKIIANLVYKTDLKDGRFLVVVAAKPEEAYDCRICAPALAGTILKNKGTEWYMGDFRYFGMAGSYGEAPDFSTKRISATNHALVAITGGLNQGYFWTGENYYSVNSGFQPIFSSNTHSDNSGTCDPEGEDNGFGPCYENKTSITFTEGDNPNGYYDLQTHQTGTDSGLKNDEIIKVDNKKNYVYQDNKYVEKKN